MPRSLHINEHAHLRQTILSQCVWSDTHSSLKHVLKRAADHLPLLVSFTADDQHDQEQTVLFFDRNVSNKILFTPLRQVGDKQDQFEVYPRHCTFAMTEYFRGVFEFIRDGRRCSRIFTTLEQLVDYATDHKCSVVFMSRDSVRGRYTDSNSSKWLSKEYPQGAIFSAQRIHRASNNRKSSNDYVECSDEEGYSVFLNMSSSGRFSLIATSINQQEKQPELYLHSSQTANIGALIKTLTLYNNNKNNNNCVRLVRGDVPHNFHCQYLQLVRQHTHDVLVGLTQEGLVVEWNLDSHTPCRYASNLNDILNKLSGSWQEQLLEGYIDESRAHYRESFKINMQLTSTRDWTALYQYWQWTGDIDPTNQDDKNIQYQSRHRFHLVVSIQDISDGAETLPITLMDSIIEQHQHKPHSSQERHHKFHKKLTDKQQRFLSEMNKILASPHHRTSDRHTVKHSRPRSLLMPNEPSPFDQSIYDSNPHVPVNVKHKSSRRTQ